jgi:hypothetical protein
MDELIMNAARELGIAEHVSVSQYSRSGEQTVVVSINGHRVTRELWPLDLMNISDLKRILLEMFEEGATVGPNT